MKKALVIINEQHSLLAEQRLILNHTFKENLKIKNVPAKGWTWTQQENIAREIIELNITHVVFVSPVPVLLRELSYHWGRDSKNPIVLVFHNDNRQKKELPNGKIISVIAKEGWQLV